MGGSGQKHQTPRINLHLIKIDYKKNLKKHLKKVSEKTNLKNGGNDQFILNLVSKTPFFTVFQ